MPLHTWLHADAWQKPWTTIWPRPMLLPGPGSMLPPKHGPALLPGPRPNLLPGPGPITVTTGLMDLAWDELFQSGSGPQPWLSLTPIPVFPLSCVVCEVAQACSCHAARCACVSAQLRGNTAPHIQLCVQYCIQLHQVPQSITVIARVKILIVRLKTEHLPYSRYILWIFFHF